jgi:hypothetical protein
MAESPGAPPVMAGVTTTFAALVVWLALILPDSLDRLSSGALLRLPVEALILVTSALILPARSRRAVALVGGAALGLLAILKILDGAFFAVLGRPFNPRTDWSYLGSGLGVLRDSVGLLSTVLAVVAAVLALLALLVVLIRSVLRLTRLAARRRKPAAWTVTVLGAGWLLCAALGVQVAGGPVAASVPTGLSPGPAARAPAGPDPYAQTPGTELLTGLRGKDVLVVFVESYGRVALEDPAIAPGVQGVLSRGDASLRAAGFSSRSAFLTSPTFAGLSWLAHSTLQSGLWIDTQQRYNSLLTSDRLTLTGAFQRAGWRTVDAVPSNGADWPEGMAFYHYDQVYDRRNVGYAGPSFSYASMPDQYTFAALQRAELSTHRRTPVLAEVDLVSSHGPWAPLPRMVDWAAVGDGSVFADMPAQGQTPEELAGSSEKTKAAYGQSIEYSLNTIISFVQTFGNDNLVLVVVGDHQPAAVVSGRQPSHDVPITVLAHDPAVLARIGSWGWQSGMTPHPDAPVWPMDGFRDRFLAAYGPQPSASPASAALSPRLPNAQPPGAPRTH